MRRIPFAGFDWDAGNREKCRKHGLTIADIEYILSSGPPFLAPDVRNSMVEPRYIAVGSTEAGRYAFVIFMPRRRAGAVLLRPISARFMHRKEIERYEKAIAGTEE
jgi:uncharacterized DUF497 family protein